MRYEINFNATDDYLSIIRNPKLSLKAKGLYAFMYHNDNNFCDFDDFLEVSKDCVDSVITGINELLKMEIVSKVKTGSDTGVVYVIGDTYGNYKIGYAKSFYLRWQSYRVAFPYGPEIIRLIKTDNMRALEKKLHKKYKDKNIRGEWFNLNKEDINYLRSIKK